jgi:hypothetical protein
MSADWSACGMRCPGEKKIDEVVLRAWGSGRGEPSPLMFI